MTITSDFLEDVNEAIAGSARAGALAFLKNFKSTGDKLGAASVATVSTKLYADSLLIAASGTNNLDLAGGITDQAGATATLTKVHAIFIRAAASNVNSVVVGGHASAAFVGPFADATDKVSVGPGETLLITSQAGWTVTATTADILKLANSGGTTGVNFDIVILGE